MVPIFNLLQLSVHSHARSRICKVFQSDFQITLAFSSLLNLLQLSICKARSRIVGSEYKYKPNQKAWQSHIMKFHRKKSLIPLPSCLQKTPCSPRRKPNPNQIKRQLQTANVRINNIRMSMMQDNVKFVVQALQANTSHCLSQPIQLTPSKEK